MTPRMLHQMAEAMRLTRLGKPAEATALIQRMLRGEGVPATRSSVLSAPVDVDSVVANAELQRTQPSAQSGGSRAARRSSGLRETLSRLAATVKARGLDRGFARAPVSDPLPSGASFTTASYSNAAGTRDYKLYIPSNRSSERLPLIVMLHGCTQSPDDFAAGTRMNALAEENGFFVCYPAQNSLANAQHCWNWFEPDDQRRDSGEPSLIAGITRQIMNSHPVDPARVYIAGLSAGGAAAAIMGETYSDLYAAVGVHSGLPAGAANDLASALDAMRFGAAIKGRTTRTVPTIVFHGDRDPIVHPSNGDALMAQALGSKAGLLQTTQHGQAPAGRSFSRTIYADPEGRPICENWRIFEAGHAWAGGSASGTYTDPRGPDASKEMLRFFMQHRIGDQ